MCLFVGANGVNLIADVGGYFPASIWLPHLDARPDCSTPAQASRRLTVKALGAGPDRAGATVVLAVAGRGGVPADADAVVLNITATAGSIGSGFVTVFACDTAQPLASSVNFGAAYHRGQHRDHRLSADGKVCLFVGGAGAVDLVADVVGFFPAGSGYHAVDPGPPARHTRPGESTVDGKQLGAGASAPGSTLVLPIAGRGGVPPMRLRLF